MVSLLALLALGATANPVSVKVDGSLKDALEAIAREGGLNVVVDGDLHEPVQVHLTSLPAEEALESVAKVYHLDVVREGKLWVVRRAAKEAALPLPPTPPAPPAAPAAPVPPVPNVEAIVKGALQNAGVDLDQEIERAQDEAEAARDEAERAREEAAQMREKAKELAEAQRERAQALKEAARERAKALSKDVKSRFAKGPVVVKEGSIVQSATSFGGPVIVEKGAIVEGDATAFGGDVVLKEDAIVEGNATAFGGQVVREKTSQVQGEAVSFADKAKHGIKVGTSRVADFLVAFALFFGLGFLVTMLAPQRMKRVEDVIRTQPVRSGLFGVLALLASLPLSVILFFTFIGWPLLALMWVALPLAVLIGMPAIANVVGAALPTAGVRKTQALVLALGLAVVLASFHLPVLGGVLVSVTTFIGVGAVLRTRFGQPPKGLPVRDERVTAAV